MERVSVTVDGRNLEGWITHRTPRGVGVRIDGPYEGSHSITRPLFAVATLQGRPEYDYMGAYGDAVIAHFLQELHARADFYDRNRSAWTARNQRLAAISEAWPDPERYRSERKELRRRFREGKMDARTHHRMRRELERRHTTWWGEMEGEGFSRKL